MVPMADCPMLARCPFFHDRMGAMHAMATTMKMVYCRGSNRNCARWTVFDGLGPQAMPSDLFPNEGERAREILADSGLQRAEG